MHICYLCDEYPPATHGGYGTYTQTMARAMAARGEQVTVIGIYAGGPVGVEDDRGVSVVRLRHAPVPKTGILVNGARLRRALAGIQTRAPIDVIEGAELSLAMLTRRTPAVRIIRMHGGHHFFSVTLGRTPRLWRGWIEHQSFRRADYMCAVSRFVAETTRQLLRLGDRPIEILPNPVNAELFRPTPEPPEDGLMLFVGTLCEKKGIRELLRALPTVVREVPHARLWVVGRDQRYPATNESFADRLRREIPPALMPHVEFKGAVAHHELPALMARAAVGIYPSHMESQGLAIIEAMASGKAVVATQTGPGPEIVEDGVSGLLCDPHDPAAIADRTIRILKDASLRNQLGAAARRRVQAEFSEPAIVERMRSYYRQCLLNGTRH